MDGVLQKEVIKAVIEKLQRILEWFLKQRTFNFFASSLLVVFDGDISPSPQSPAWSSPGPGEDVVDSCCNGETDSIIENDVSDLISCDSVDSKTNRAPSTHPKVQVRMIDFAHVFHMENEDENYIFGLKHLIDDLHRLMKS